MADIEAMRGCRGLHVVAQTPFREDGALDLDSIDTLSAFYYKHGAQGLRTAQVHQGEEQCRAEKAYRGQCPDLEQQRSTCRKDRHSAIAEQHQGSTHHQRRQKDQAVASQFTKRELEVPAPGQKYGQPRNVDPGGDGGGQGDAN